MLASNKPSTSQAIIAFTKLSLVQHNFSGIDYLSSFRQKRKQSEAGSINAASTAFPAIFTYIRLPE